MALSTSVIKQNIVNCPSCKDWSNHWLHCFFLCKLMFMAKKLLSLSQKMDIFQFKIYCKNILISQSPGNFFNQQSRHGNISGRFLGQWFDATCKKRRKTFFIILVNFCRFVAQLISRTRVSWKWNENMFVPFVAIKM